MGPTWKSLGVSALLIVGSRAADLYATSVVTSDLVLEANPVVRLTGMGWSGLLAFQITVALILVGLRALDLFVPRASLPAEERLTFEAFVARWYVGRPWPAWKCLSLWSRPRTKQAWARLLGYVLVGTLVLLGFWIAGIMLATATWPLAARCYNVRLGGFCLGRLTPLILALPVSIALHYWSLRCEYARYTLQNAAAT